MTGSRRVEDLVERRQTETTVFERLLSALHSTTTILARSQSERTMTEVKRNFDDDDGDLKDIDVDGKIGMSSSDEEEEVEEEANEVMDLPEGGLDALPDLWLVKVCRSNICTSESSLGVLEGETATHTDPRNQLPKSLMERWSKIEDPNVTLAKIRVYPAVECVPDRQWRNC